MDNCFIVLLGNRPVAIFKTEIAAENFLAAMGWGADALGDGQAVIEPHYVFGIPF
jgi:hypothetical protein